MFLAFETDPLSPPDVVYDIPPIIIMMTAIAPKKNSKMFMIFFISDAAVSVPVAAHTELSGGGVLAHGSNTAMALAAVGYDRMPSPTKTPKISKVFLKNLTEYLL